MPHKDAQGQERKIGVGAHPEEEVHPAHGSLTGLNPVEKDLINKYSLERARYYGKGRRLKEK